MQNLILSLQCVLPMFLILLLGMLIRRSRIVPDSSFDQMNLMTFRFLMPCLLFYSIYAADINNSFQPGTIVFLLCWVLVWFILSFIVFAKAEPDPKNRGAYIQTAYRSNLAVIGVTLAQSMLGESGIATMAMAIAVIVPLFNVLAVITLEACRGGVVSFRQMLINILRNPLIWGCLTGILFLALGIQLPKTVEGVIAKIGTTASTMMLITLGASIQLKGVKDNLRQVIFCDVLRLVVSPICALTVSILLGFRGDALGVILIASASPTAAASYSMAMACDSNYELTGQSVVTTSFFCSLTLFIWIFLLKQLGFM